MRFALEPSILIRHLAVCFDYDGTLAHDGVLDGDTVEALERLKSSGRHLVMVTGRELDDLRHACQRLDLFDRIVAENGALLFTPATGEETLLSDPPIPAFVDALQRRGVQPMSVGRGIVATWKPHDVTVMQTIRDLGLELQVIFNKDAVMILAPGVNKASGAEKGLASLGLSPHNAVAIGDAENDHAMLATCQLGVAVANALPSVKAKADFVTHGDHGAGVREFIDELLGDDLSTRASQSHRHRIEMGRTRDDAMLTINPNDNMMLIVGPSASGKSSVAQGMLERLVAQAYSFCVIDPEGDYLDLAHAIVVGTAANALTVDEAAQALQSGHNVVLNLLGIALADRPGFLTSLIPVIEECRVRTGQPHCVLVDEAHHMLGDSQPEPVHSLAARLDRSVLVTVHPDFLRREYLRRVNTLIIVGAQADTNLQQFASKSARSLNLPDNHAELAIGDAYIWQTGMNCPSLVTILPSRTEHHRHSRKYAEGHLDEVHSFFFRGAQSQLNLRAQNLSMFVQMAAGVDDQTWQYHLKRHDYSNWIASQINDAEVAEQIHAIEDDELSTAESRTRVRQAIEAVYTLPA